MASSDSRWSVLLLLGMIEVGVAGNVTRSEQKSSLISIPSNYVQTQPPIPEHKALKIYLDIGIWAIRDISASTMDMDVDLLVYVSWRDLRVEINQTMVDGMGARIPVGDDGPKLWLPVMAFKNCKGCNPLNLNPKVFLIHYVPEFTSFWTVMRIAIKLSCNIDLRSFPMDRQNCKIQLENCYEDTSKVIFVHKHSGPYTFISDLQLSEFRVLGVIPGDCTATYGNKSYTCIEIEIRLARIMGYHLTTTFAPTSLIVMLSWISFWLPVELAPARITLGVTSLLTLATRLDQAQKNLPAVSYVKAIDIWMFACIFLVFASLVEFSLSYYCASLKKSPPTPRSNPVLEKHFRSNNLVRPVDHSSTNPTASTNRAESTMMDRIAKFLFPGTFLIFNICYWSKYLSNYYDD